MARLMPETEDTTMPPTPTLRTTLTATIGLMAAAALAQEQHPEHAGAATAEKLGTVHFAMSCSAAVTADFNRAVALLHSFEFRPAIAGFESVLERDSACAIAHWGIALSYWGNPFAGARAAAALEQGLAAVTKGRATGTPTARERAYIEAVAALFVDHATISQRDRILAYERRMAEVVRQHPTDMEATIFHALAVNQTALPTDKTYAAQLSAATTLEPLFKEHPDHPGLAHYIIHAYDHPPLAARALDAARRYAAIAPSAPHALHMPSHTFTRVGSWQESVDTNRLSEETAVRLGVAAEALHAMDYQTYAYLQMAQDRAARAVLERVPAVAAQFDATATAGGAAPPLAGFYALAAIPARYALERGAWQEAAGLGMPASGTPFTIAIAHSARALGAARSGRPAAAAEDIARLAVLRDQLRTQDAYWSEQIDIQWRVATAWAAFAAGRKTEGVETLRAAAAIEDATDKSAVTPGPLAPARESLGDMLLEAGDAAAAVQAYAASIAKEPGRFRGAYGAARAAEANGDAPVAHRYYETVLELSRNADSTRPEIERARAFVRRSQ
jgi:hypothetical protein